MNNMLDNLTQRQQQYLETVYELQRQGGTVGTKALADSLGVRMPSVTQAVSRLVRDGYLSRTPAHAIRLTARGRAAAQRLGARHAVLRKFMTEVLGMDVRTADEESCRIEHATRGVFVRKLADFTRSIASGDLTTCRKALDAWKEAARMKP